MDGIEITYEFPAGMSVAVVTAEETSSVLASLEDAMHELQAAIEQQYQPQRMRDAYDVIVGSDAGSVGGTAQESLVNDSGALYPSFVGGSAPHFPPWMDPDLVRWAEAHGIPAFLVAKSVAEHGTPAHPAISELLDQYEERIADGMVEGLDAWLDTVWI